MLQPTEAQITRDQFLLVLSDALEHNWDFETDRIDVEIKRVGFESSKRILPPTFHLSEAQLKIGSRRHRTINL